MHRIFLIFILGCQLSVIRFQTAYSLTYQGITTPWHHGTTASVINYDSLWIHVDSLNREGLPNSALAIVDHIYNQAKTSSDDPQLVKAILYRISLNSTFQENAPLESILDLRNEIERSRPPVTQILSSILGELYDSYYQRNRYRINGRAPLTGRIQGNPETWDARRFLYEMILEYRQSLSDEALLQEIPLDRYRGILDNPSAVPEENLTFPLIHSTLFDFLSQRALQFFTRRELPITQPSKTFTLDHRVFFAQTPEFIDFPLKPQGIHARPGDGTFIPVGTDTLSLTWYAIRIYQALAQFHLNNKNPEALIYWELQRLSFVHQQSTLSGKDSLYLTALREFEHDYRFSPASTEISFELAQALINEGETFNPLVSEAHRWELKDALTISTDAVERFPESLGGKNCKSLIKKILASSLMVSAEYAIIPDHPALASLAFKNIPFLYFRLIKADPETAKTTFSGLKQEEVFNYLRTMKAVSQWEIPLPFTGDYQEHRTEISIPPVQPGYYILFTSADSLFQNPAIPFSYQAIWSSGISYISQRNLLGSIDIFLLDRKTGSPLKEIFTEVFSKTYDNRTRQYVLTKTGEFHSVQSGFFTIPPPLGKGSHSNLILSIHHGDDFLISEPLYVYPAADHQARPVEQTRFFTDRAIYRPGQPIYFKGIVLERTGDSTSLKGAKKTLVTFSDVNGQIIMEQWFTTDDYGSFNGSFTAPSGVLLGDMRIFNESGSIVIAIEEYKRPTFEVLFSPVEGNYRLGEMVNITGKALGYAGNAIDAGMVTYRVVRTASFPYWRNSWRLPFPSSPEVEISNGTLLTGTDGSFLIPFYALPDNSISRPDQPVFTFQVFVTVTDLKGESRSAQESVSIGYTSLLINLSLPERLNLHSGDPFILTTTNLNGRITPTKVQITLDKLSGPMRAFKPRQWEQPDTMILSRDEFYKKFPNDIYGADDNPDEWPMEKRIFSRPMNTVKDTMIYLTDSGYAIRDNKGKDPGSQIPDPGSYKLTLSATDPFGQEVEKVIYFTAFDLEARRVPVPVMNWFVPVKSSGEPGEMASFLIGTSEKEIRVIQEIRVKEKLCSRVWITLRNQQKVVEIPILEEFRGNFSVNFIFVCQNRVFQNSQVVSVPYTNKKLDIHFETFRNKLMPGQQEEWKIRITDADHKGLPASFLTTMYDRSLDQFRSNTWSFDLFRHHFYGDPWEVNDDFRTTSDSWYASWLNSLNFHYSNPYQLNWFGMQISGYGPPWRGGMKGQGLFKNQEAYFTEAESMLTAGQNPPPPPPMDDLSNPDQPDKARDRSPENQTIPVFPVRKDFRETAFFYPSLLSDSSGYLHLKFTVPEVLTSWKLLGLAYTKQLDYGLLEKEVVTKKDLMVFPNAPRFVRQGDTVVFIARIVNLSDHEISGEAKLDLSEAITMQPLNQLILDTGYGIWDTGNINRESRIADRISFHISPGQSTTVSWTLVMPVSKFINMLQYTVLAQAGDFSDGETNILPVLSNRMLVTETLPLPVNGKGSFDFTFDNVLKSASLPSLINYRLTLEFASSPAWFAIQALPSLNQKNYRNTDQIFDAFYANALAAHIANANQKIRQVFESWKSLTPDALLSNLQKNEELKSAILEETPWVMEAKNETESRRNLGLFFDHNNLQQNLSENLKQIRQMQYPSGGWPWFEGMQENRLVTLSIVTGLGKLNHLGVRFAESSADLDQMVLAAFSYLDREMMNDYKQMEKTFPEKMEENHLTPFQVKYLYALSLFNRLPDTRYPMPDREQGIIKALEYYTSQARNFWLKQDLTSQAMIAFALNRIGDDITPKTILKSLSERALHSPELGMYWAAPGGYEWYQQPVERQSMLIEAFDEVANDQKSVEEMQVWLLKQKQTHMWKTKQATVDACYALLLRGTNILAADPQVRIKLGNLEIDPASMPDIRQDAGTGYFRMSWSGEAIRPEMGNIRVTKSTNGIAWGGLYWQYFENLDQITAHETPLTVEKQIFLEKNTEAGPMLERISDAGYQMPDSASSIQDPALLQIGDKLKVRLIVTVDRNMDFVHLKDMRAAGLEPLSPSPSPKGAGIYPQSLSGYRYQDGLGYYQSITDLATNFFFDYLPKGTWVFEYPLVVNNAGDFSTGIATIQCMYAPEFSAHSEGSRLEVGK
ncbi:MAG: hypothetical protein JXA23_03515 [Bacteroidales bacterium]|nr:hypothetical protein [Bacteroidales bacterium]